MIRHEPLVLGPRDATSPLAMLSARTRSDETAPDAPTAISHDWQWSKRGLIVTLLVSLGLHAAAVTAVLLLLHAGVPVADIPDKPPRLNW